MQYKTTQEIRQKKPVNFILENTIPKAITEVYFELLVTNFYTQIFCSCHSKFVKIIPIIFMHPVASPVFGYISFPASNKMFCKMSWKLRAKIMAQFNFVQWLQVVNQDSYSDFNTRRSSWFLSQQYLTSLHMRHTNVP